MIGTSFKKQDYKEISHRSSKKSGLKPQLMNWKITEKEHLDKLWQKEILYWFDCSNHF